MVVHGYFCCHLVTCPHEQTNYDFIQNSRWGVFFIGAITLSMFVSQIVLSMARKIVIEEKGEQTYSKKRRWLLFDQLYLAGQYQYSSSFQLQR